MDFIFIFHVPSKRYILERFLKSLDPKHLRIELFFFNVQGVMNIVGVAEIT